MTDRAPVEGMAEGPCGGDEQSRHSAGPSAQSGESDVLVRNSEFLAVLASQAPAGAALWVCSHTGNPNNAGSQWGGHQWRPGGEEVDAWGKRNSYYSVAALAPAEDGTVSRRRAGFAGLLALVIDDADVTSLEDIQGGVTYALETSPGKYHVGIFIDQDDDSRNEPLCSALVTRMQEMGRISGDKSGNSVVRYVRLPCGENQKPRDSGSWAHRLRTWDPRRVLSLEDAASAFGVNLDKIRSGISGVSVNAGAPKPVQTDRVECRTGKIGEFVGEILRQKNLHDNINKLAASLIASGAHGGSIVMLIRSLMEQTPEGLRDERWNARYFDIARSVSSAKKFMPAEAALQEPKRILTPAGELLTNLKPAQFVVDGYVERDSLVMIYGESGCGKSFVAVDLACCVATSNPWHGREVESGPVIFVAGEGQNGIARRLAAWAKHYETPLVNAPLFVSRCAVGVGDSASLLPLIYEIDEIAQRLGEVPVAVIIDTVARNFGPGDENSTQDMAGFIGNLDTYIRQRFGCSVILIHHTGHQGDRARGSSALRAALDQEFRVESKNSGILLGCTKMKDGETPPGLMFCLQQHELGQDEDGQPILGAALAMDRLVDFSNRPGLKGGALQVLSAFLATAVPDTSNGEVILGSEDGWRAAYYQANADKEQEALKKAFGRAKKTLLAQRYVSEVARPSAAFSYEGRLTDIVQALGQSAVRRDSPGTGEGHVPVPDSQWGGTAGTHP